MKKLLLTISWAIFFIVSFYSLVKIDQWYVYSRVPASLPKSDYFLDMWDEGYATVSGTIRGKGDDYYDEFNTIKIECVLSEKQCSHYVAGLFNPAGSFDYEPLLNVKAETFQIVTWNKEFLIYRQTRSCYVSTFTLVKDTKTLTGITKYSNAKKFCQRDDEVSFSIIDGFDFVQAEKKKVSNVFANALAAFAIFCISAFGIFRVFRKRK